MQAQHHLGLFCPFSWHLGSLSCRSVFTFSENYKIRFTFLRYFQMCKYPAYHYIPPFWIMCTESVAHLMVMLNFSSNFLIYCSVSKQFKLTLSKARCHLCLGSPSPPVERSDSAELETVAVALPTSLMELSVHLIFKAAQHLPVDTDIHL